MTGSDRRRSILEAAARLFEHYGHGKTTIADVAREARIGVGTVYLEFESKEAILHELSVSTHDGVLAAMRTAARDTRDPAAKVSAALVARTRAFLELRRKGEHSCELLHCSTEAVRAAGRRFEREELALLETILEEGRRAGVFRPCDEAHVAALVRRAFASLSPPWIFSCVDDPVQTAGELCALLLNGLLVDRDPAIIEGTPVKAAKTAKKNAKR